MRQPQPGIDTAWLGLSHLHIRTHTVEEIFASCPPWVTWGQKCAIIEEPAAESGEEPLTHHGHRIFQHPTASPFFGISGDADVKFGSSRRITGSWMTGNVAKPLEYVRHLETQIRGRKQRPSLPRPWLPPDLQDGHGAWDGGAEDRPRKATAALRSPLAALPTAN